MRIALRLAEQLLANEAQRPQKSHRAPLAVDAASSGIEATIALGAFLGLLAGNGVGCVERESRDESR